MGWLERLAEQVRSIRGAKVDATDSSSSLTVPDDHHVTFHPPDRLPGLGETHGDALIVHLGSPSDEFEAELDALRTPIRQELERRAARDPARPVLFATEATRLSDLFLPNDPKVVSLAGLVIWTIDAGSAALWRDRTARLEAALAEVSSFRIGGARLRHVSFIKIDLKAQRDGGPLSPKPPSGTRSLVRLLQRSGVEVRRVPSDGQFLVEVCRPDAVIASFRGEIIGDLRSPDDGAGDPRVDDAAHERTGCIVSRAPRLHRLLLAALAAPAIDPPVELLEELRVRSIPLLVLADAEGCVAWRSWPGRGVAIPVHPDLDTLERAASELGLGPGQYAVAEASVRELAAWCATRADGRIAICTYDRNQPRHVFLEGGVLRSLVADRGLTASS